MENRIFIPHELKTIEVDAEKKIFRVNGEDFGENCTGFTIHCNRYNDFDVRIEIGTTVIIATYGEDQQKTNEHQYKTDAPWFSPGATVSS